MAVNCWLCDAVKVTPVGVTPMLTVGIRFTAALPDPLGSATLVALTVTVLELEMVFGAV